MYLEKYPYQSVTALINSERYQLCLRSLMSVIEGINLHVTLKLSRELKGTFEELNVTPGSDGYVDQ